MSTEVRLRKGTDAQHAAFAGALAETTVNTTKKALHVHDGSTLGGNRTLMVSELGQPSGVAPLDSGGNIPAQYLGQAGLSAFDSIASLKGANTATVSRAYLNVAGREGVFIWTSGNFSAQITADTQGAVYLKADAVAVTSGAWVRAYSGSLNLKWFGVVGDGTTSDQTAVQAAVDLAGYLGKVLYVPEAAVSYRLTAPVINTNKSGVKIKGEGTEITENNNYNANTVNTRGRGSWFFLDHAGKGFEFTGRDNGTGLVGNSQIGINGIGTYRNQPTPGPGWTPGAFDYDFDFTQCTADIEDLTLLNPTNGINWKRGRAGQLNISRVRGQPLTKGIRITNAYDVVRIKDVHFWRFWSMSSNVATYMLTNAVGIETLRNDNPIFSDIFTYGYNRAIYVSHFAGNGVDEPAGTTYHASIDNLCSDFGESALVVGASSAGFTGSITRMYHEQSTSVTVSAPAVALLGTSASLHIGTLVSNNTNAQALIASGADNKVVISRLQPGIFNRSSLGFPAVQADGTNAVVRIGETIDVGSGGGSPIFSETNGGLVTGLTRCGAATIASGSSGVTITHGLGIEPRSITFELVGTGAQAVGANLPRVTTKNQTTFTVDIGVVASGTRQVMWIARF